MNPGKLFGLANTCLGIAAAGLVTSAQTGAAQERGGALLGKPAPAFHLNGMYHEDYSLESFKGHILVMQFGASW